MSELNSREQTLVSLGASVASNCIPCIEYHLPEAKKTGLSDLQIREAIRVADKVRRVPARMVLQAALAKIDGRTMGADQAQKAECGCGESGQVADSGCNG